VGVDAFVSKDAFVCKLRTPFTAVVQGMTPRQIAMLAAAGGAGKQEAGAAEAEGDVCGSAGSMTTVRAIDAPYTYSSRQRRRALRQQAEKYVPIITAFIVPSE
jgi:hypothetical protein